MKQVDAAIHLVSEGEGASDLIWMWLYQHASYGGWSYLLMQPQGSRYRNVRYIGDGYNDQASSLKVLESQGERGLAILFENVPYEGRYATFPGESGGTAATGNVGPFINDLTSSLMLVRRAPPEREIPFTLGGILRPEIQQFATSISQQVSLRGQPIVTWDMWPDFSPSSKYVYLRVPVTVHVPGWFDYSAEIRYWIYPWVDGQGQLKAYVAAYGCWVEGGILSGTVADQIMQALPGTVGTVNTKIDDLMRAMVIFGPYTECYLLPGTSGYPGTAPVTGNTTDDVTVVLVRK